MRYNTNVLFSKKLIKALNSPQPTAHSPQMKGAFLRWYLLFMHLGFLGNILKLCVTTHRELWLESKTKFLTTTTHECTTGLKIKSEL